MNRCVAFALQVQEHVDALTQDAEMYLGELRLMISRRVSFMSLCVVLEEFPNRVNHGRILSTSDIV